MENEITKAPFDWETGNTNQGDKPPQPVEPIEGGLSDERFGPTTMDKIRDAAIVASFTPQMIGVMMDFIKKNWKTALAGLIGIAVQILPQLGVIDQQTANAISVIAASLGLVAAKDSNVTGGTKPQ